MAVFRVEKNRGYTVMSNHHLRNKDLSLKAKGLLSLPEDWDFTLKGLSLINREQIDAIRAAVKELEQAGYIVRSRELDSQGRLRRADYIIYEQPQPVPDSPTLENPTLDNPTLEKPTQEKPTQLNKDRSSKEKSMTDGSNTDSIPILSPPSPLGEEAAAPPERKGTGAKSQSAVEIYREIIKDNIEYEHLCQYAKGIDRDMLDEIVDLLVETVCSARKTIRIAGDDYPAELVKSKLMKLDSSHIEFVFDCISKNTTEIRNIKKYLADGFSLAFESAAPSFHLFDLAVGVAGAVALRLMVYPQDRPEQKCAGDRRFRQRQDPVLCEAQPHAVRIQGLPDLIRDYRPERKSDRRGGPAPCTVRLPTSIRKRTF